MSYEWTSHLTGFIWLTIRNMAGSFDHRIELSDSEKRKKYLDQLREGL